MPYLYAIANWPTKTVCILAGFGSQLGANSLIPDLIKYLHHLLGHRLPAVGPLATMTTSFVGPAW
jgi:hypothetical protein